MHPDLQDNTWTQCGTSLLWDAVALTHLCPADSVRSLREFLRLHQAGWPDAALKLTNGRVLVVAGLDSAMDTLPPEGAVEWLEQKVYPAILDFQEVVADGGREAALIFWLANGSRVRHRAADNTHHWLCSGTHRSHEIPIGRCVWNGAEGSVRRIVTSTPEGKTLHVGLYQQRIS